MACKRPFVGVAVIFLLPDHIEIIQSAIVIV